MVEWKRVKDGAGYPSETMDTLVVDEYGHIKIARFMEPTGAWWDKGLNGGRVNATYWMPLPDLPEEV